MKPLFPVYSAIAFYLTDCFNEHSILCQFELGILFIALKRLLCLNYIFSIFSLLLQLNNQVLPRLAGMFFKVGNLIRNFFDNNWARGKQNYSTTEQKGAKLFFSNTKVTYSKFQFTISGDVFSQLCQYFCPLKNYSTFSCFPQNAKSFLIWTK